MYFKDREHVGVLLDHFQNFQNNRIESSVKVISISESVHEGTHPATIIEVQIQNGEIFYLRLKYSEKEEENKNIEYESKIYECVLSEIPLTSIKYFGIVKENNLNFLLTQFLSDAVKIKIADPISFSYAAEWIASFHKIWEGKCFPFLRQYDQKYFEQWAARLQWIDGIRNKTNWLSNLVEYYFSNIPVLISGTNTIVHGEYYGKNIMIKDAEIYPVDWETCGYGPAEMDLAALIEGKSPERIEYATQGYITSRHPHGIPRNFEKKLMLAELYFKFRWMAEWISTGDELEVWLVNTDFGNRLKYFAKISNCY